MIFSFDSSRDIFPRHLTVNDIRVFGLTSQPRRYGYSFVGAANVGSGDKASDQTASYDLSQGRAWL